MEAMSSVAAAAAEASGANRSTGSAAAAGGAAALGIGTGGDAKSAPRKRTKWSKPKRAKTAYNFFFSEERLRILAERDRQDGQADESKDGGSNEVGNSASVDAAAAGGGGKSSSSKRKKKQPHGKISFQELGSEISKRWKLVSPEDMARYDAMASKDTMRYRKEMEEYEAEKMAAMYMLQSDMMANQTNRNPGTSQPSAAGASSTTAAPRPVAPAAGATHSAMQQPIASNSTIACQPMPLPAGHVHAVPFPQMQTKTLSAPAPAPAPANTNANVSLNHLQYMPFAASFTQPTVSAAQAPAQMANIDTTTAHAQTLPPNQGQQQSAQYHVFSGIGHLSESQVQQITQALQQQMHQQGGTVASSAPASIPFGYETASSSITSSQALPAALLERLTSTSGDSSSSSSPFFPVSNQGYTGTSQTRSGSQMPSSMAVTVNASTVSSSSSGTATKTETATASIGGRQVPVRIHHHNHYVTISEETGEVEVLSSSGSSDEKEGAVTSTSPSRSRSRSRSSNKSMENDSLSSMSTLTSIKLSIAPAPHKKKDDASLSDISTSTAELKYSNIEAGRLPPRKRRSPSSSASTGGSSSCNNSSSGSSNDSSSVDSSDAVCGAKRAKFGKD